MDNVKLWFAKDGNENIVTINDITETNKNDTYSCPMCASKLIPKAIKSKQVTSHFAHVDAGKCNQESMVHFWFKHKFIEIGDSFAIVLNEEKKYICKDVLVEQEYSIGDRIYKPDVTVITECGNIVYFEMAFSNKKNVKDYLDIWLELKNIVVEVNVKQLMFKEEVPKFKALFYSGKCFNTKKNDIYYNIIGKYKEEKFKGQVNNELKERVKKLDWFWNDVLRYKVNKVDIEHMTNLIENIDSEDRDIVNLILNKSKCTIVLKEYIANKLEKVRIAIENNIRENYEEEFVDWFKYSIDYDGYYHSYSGEIAMYSACAGYSKRYDIESSTLEEIVEKSKEYIEKNLKHYKNKETIDRYNGFANTLKNNIIKNEKYKSYSEEIHKNNPNYTLSLDVDTIIIKPLNLADDFNEEKFNIKSTLRYNNEQADRLEISTILLDDINLICDKIVSKFNSYFENLDVLNNIDELNFLVDKLNKNFSQYNVVINGSVKLENIYEISTRMKHRSYLGGYYITNKGILDNKKDSYLKLNTSEIYSIEKYLSDDLKERIKEEVKTRCWECDKEFTLELGELRFFIHKGFDLPKRCKCCRKNKTKETKI